MTKSDDTRYCLVWVFKLFNISIKLYHPSFFWDLRIKTQILQRVSLFIQDSSKKQHFVFFFLNIIILKCSPFFKRSKDKKKPKSFRQAKWQFLSTKTSRSLLLTTLNCFINLFLCSSSKQTFNLKAQNCLSHILKHCTFSQHGDIQLSPPHKIHWSQDDCIKEKRDLLHWLILTPFNCFILT